MEQGAAAAAPGRPRGVGVSGRLGSGSSSLQSLPRQRSHHLDPACLGRCCRCEAPRLRPRSLENAEPAPRPASQSGAPRGVSRHGGEPRALPWSPPLRIPGVGGERAGAPGLLRTGSVRCLSEPRKDPANAPHTAWEPKRRRTPPCLPASPHPEAGSEEWQGKQPARLHRAVTARLGTGLGLLGAARKAHSPLFTYLFSCLCGHN